MVALCYYLPSLTVAVTYCGPQQPPATRPKPDSGGGGRGSQWRGVGLLTQGLSIYHYLSILRPFPSS